MKGKARKFRERKEKEAEAIYSLSETIVEECWIRCDRCDKEFATLVTDALDAARDFYIEGWRTDKYGYAIGPKCARKK